MCEYHICTNAWQQYVKFYSSLITYCSDTGRLLIRRKKSPTQLTRSRRTGMNERGKDVSFSLVTTIMLTCFLQCSDGGQVWLKMLPISDLGLCGNLLVLVMCHWEKCVNIVHNFCTIVHKPLLLDIFFALSLIHI